MTGRGSGRLIIPSDKPSVTIGLSLSTSPTSLSLLSTEPFYVVVTARILSTPHPEKSITLRTDPNPLEGLSNRSFHNITFVTNPSKNIDIWPIRWLFPRDIDQHNLRAHFPFVTIPREDHGTYVVRHEVPRDKMHATGLEKGERYSVQLTDKCLGTKWWAFGSLEEMDGCRFATHRSKSEAEAEEHDDAGLAANLEHQQGGEHGNAPEIVGEEPRMLALVPEVGEVEFEII